MTTAEIETVLGSEDVRHLLEAAEQTGGTVRQHELHEVLEPLDLDVLELEAFRQELEQRGIEIIEEERAPEPAPRLSRSSSRRRRTPCSSSSAKPVGIHC